MSNSKKIFNATKWSMITEILLRLSAPIVNVILARLLVPEAFGLVATITIVVSLAEVFQDAGFQKYIIQHDFTSNEELNQYSGVAFFSSVFFSIILWLIIFLFSKPLAILVGDKTLWLGITVASLSLPVTALSGIPMARFRREFFFRELFLIRLSEAFTPLFVTVPLALIFPSYWSLIWGTLAKLIVRCLGIFWVNHYKQVFTCRFYFNKSIFKKMFGFSMWTTVEYMSIWLTVNLPVFIIGNILTPYYLGIYRTIVLTVSQVLSIASAALIPVAFSAFSRLQGNLPELQITFLGFQKAMASILIPMGIGCWLFRETIVLILLGNQWTEGTLFFGIYAIGTSIVSITCYLGSETYRALGQPKTSTIVQMIYIALHGCIIYMAAKQGFTTLVLFAPISQIIFCLIHFFFIYRLIRISVFQMVKNVAIYAIASLGMIPVTLFMQNISMSIICNLFAILLCIITYFSILIVIPSTRKEFFTLKNYLKKTN